LACITQFTANRQSMLVTFEGAYCHVKSFRVLSAPQVTIHGCVGWNSQSRTPTSFCSLELWQRSIFTGTINGFCIRSLQTPTNGNCKASM